MRLIPLQPDVGFIGLVWEMRGKKDGTEREESKGRGRKKGWEEDG